MQVMTDIEVYGNEMGARVFQLSAVAFDMDGKINDPHELMQVEDCWFDAVVWWNGKDMDYPVPLNRDTIQWWASHEQNEARAVLLKHASDSVESMPEALARFSRFARPRLGKKGGHWANSPGYDLRTLRDLYDKVELPLPWHYRQERDMRTLLSLVKKLAPVKRPDMENIGLVKHNGLHDAARQAVLVQAGYRALGLRAGDYARIELPHAAAS